MKRVLIAVDGSKFSERAFGYSLERAKESGNHLTILQVVSGFGYDETPSEEALSEEINKAKDFVEELEKIAEEEGVSVNSEVITGTNIATRIVNYANENNYDLIVMGSKGMSDVGRINLGSVTHGVLERARCPVLVVH
ncbi:MAG: universal stress protein [Hadesarchaea archaeon]|nr:universal stress protein [Hadesarchaea archaeon]